MRPSGSKFPRNSRKNFTSASDMKSGSFPSRVHISFSWLQRVAGWKRLSSCRANGRHQMRPETYQMTVKKVTNKFHNMGKILLFHMVDGWVILSLLTTTTTPTTTKVTEMVCYVMQITFSMFPRVVRFHYCAQVLVVSSSSPLSHFIYCFL